MNGHHTQTKPRGFLRDQDGAVTVDWVVLVAAVLLLSIPALGVISPAVSTYADSIGTRVVDAND